MKPMKPTNLQEIYLQFGVYDVPNYEAELFYALGGTFASRAWRVSNDEYHDVLGQQFDAITGDDGQQWNLSRRYIRRVASQEEFGTLWEKSVQAFKDAVEWEQNH